MQEYDCIRISMHIQSYTELKRIFTIVYIYVYTFVSMHIVGANKINKNK